jgi:hypothetical protein
MTSETTPANSANAQRTKVLVLTYYYRPEPNFITADVAEGLAGVVDVTVVTAHPSYPTGRFTHEPSTGGRRASRGPAG